jgi:hypothetical protein
VPPPPPPPTRITPAELTYEGKVIVVDPVMVTTQLLPLFVTDATELFPTSTTQPSVEADLIDTAFAGDKFGSVTSMTAAIAAERNAKTKFLNLKMRTRRVNEEKFFLNKVRVSESDL